MNLRIKVLLPLAFFSVLLLGYLYGYWIPRSLANIRAEFQHFVGLTDADERGSNRSSQEHASEFQELFPVIRSDFVFAGTIMETDVVHGEIGQ